MSKPFIVYYGGKRRDAKHIVPLIRENLSEDGTYYEPFVGGGAIWLALGHNKNYIADILPDLINMYQCIKDNPERVLFYYNKLENSKERYYQIRNFDRNHYFGLMSKEFRASRFIYLAITGYGSVRYNSKGLMNQSYFQHPERDITIKSSDYWAMNEILQNTEVKLQSFEETLKLPKEGDFVYLDPPYIESRYDDYYIKHFTYLDMQELKERCDDLTRRGVKFALSHSRNKKVFDLFEGYNRRILDVKRNMRLTQDSTYDGEQDYLITNF